MALPQLLRTPWSAVLVVSCAFAEHVARRDAANTALPPCCHLQEAALNSCAKEVIDASRAYFFKGIEEIGVPPLDPMRMDRLKIDYGDFVISMKGELRDVVMRGIGNFQMRTSTFDTKSGLYRTDILIPRAEMTARYDLQVRILGLHAREAGHFEGVYENLRISGDNTFAYRNDTSDSCMLLTDVRDDVTVERGRLRLLELFDRNPILKTVSNAYVDSHWRELFTHLKPVIMQNVNRHRKSILNFAFSAPRRGR